MAREQPLAILDPLRRLINRQTGSSLTDGELLENFVKRRDEPSFEVLVWRHGAMVLAVCKRVLRDGHEAEDAFQATFLVLARKASSVGRGEVVAAWLYKVAYRIALRLRAASVNRPTTLELAEELPAADSPGDAEWRDLQPVLDDEIAKLPEKYRRPFVLCHLEGLTNEEAAAQLGCPKGTILSRLSRGRERLRARLARRGVALTATALALALSQNAASASVTAALVAPTVGAAIPFAAGKVALELVPSHVAALAEGVLKTMALINVKVAAAVLALATVLGTGITWAASGSGGSPDRSGPPAPVAAAIPAPEPNGALAEGQREGQRDRPAAPAPGVAGKVIAVAKDGKSFTLETPAAERGGEPTKTEVKFGAKVAVTYNGVGLNGAKPTEGYHAQVGLEANSKDVAATVAFSTADGGRRSPDVVGTVVNGVDNKSITLEVRPKERGERGAVPPKETIPFDDKTVLEFANVEKDGAKITAGYSATVWLAEDGKTAAKVQLTGTGEPTRRDQKRADVMGKVMKIDGKTLVVQTPAGRGGDEANQITITLGDKMTTLFTKVPADGAKPAPGMLAHVWYAEGSKDTAAKVIFFGTVPERWTFVSGKVVAVAKDGNSFTVEAPATRRGEEPKRTEIKLTAKTKASFFGIGPNEAKVTEGLIAQVELADGSTDTAAQVTFGKPGERGARER